MHLLVIVIIIFLLFPKRLAELGRSLGECVHGLRQSFGGNSSAPAAKAENTKDTKA
jgi:TatA/E family protein of Tat protein translocase